MRAGLVWFVVSTLALVAPVFTTIGNAIEPRVFGLPWSLCYVLAIIALNCGVLSWLYVRRAVDSREAEEPS